MFRLLSCIFILFVKLHEGHAIDTAIDSATNINYCDKKMCPHQGTHVACNKTKAFGPICRGKPELIDLAPYHSFILHKHNMYRNIVAKGQLKCLYPAVRMPRLSWCNDLAETASYNARSCVFAHDQCRATKKYPMAGQNIYMTKTRNTNKTNEAFIDEAIYLWFNEQQDATDTVMKSFHKTVPQTGHFTLMASDRQDCMGCSLMRDFWLANPDVPNDVDRLYAIFVCNYSMTNIRNLPSYKAGPTAAACKNISRDYDGLCDDPIDPNDLNWYNTP